MGAVRAAASVLVLAFWCAFGTLMMLLARSFNLRLKEYFPLIFHGFVCKLFSLRCEPVGEPTMDKPVLYVSNHISYLDVFVLGSMIEGSFVAKSEVSSWPVFGKLAKLQNTLFLERNARRAVDQIATLRNHLQQEGNLIMFPEGTSTSGTYVAPFRSTLFAAAEGVTIQPVTVAYVGREGKPMTQDERDRYAWYLPNPKEHPKTPNQPFVAHFFAGLRQDPCTVKVLFHETVTLEAGDRKECALRCEALVRDGLVSLQRE